VGGFGYPRKSPVEYSMRVLSTALGSFGIGRLYKEIRDEKGLAYAAYMHVSPGPTTGQFVAATDTKPQTAAEALAATLKILEDTATAKPLSQAEIATASDMYLNSFAFRFDSAEKILREKAAFDLFGYPEDYLDTFRANISKVDVGAAQQAAQKLYDRNSLQIVVVGPRAIAPSLAQFGPVTVIEDVEAFK
jgi:zinc protease